MLTLQDAMKAVAGREEFLVKRYDNLVAINYLVTLPDSFDGIRREFRGITFDERSGAVVSLPLHKFFNVGQKPETQPDRLRGIPGKVYEKLDGSMIHFFWHDGQLRAATRMGADTPHAEDALKLANRLGLVDEICRDVRVHDCTPIFEYVSPTNQIVVHYKKPRLVHLHSRCRRSGKYIPHNRFPDRAQNYPFTFDELSRHLDRENFEGYVVVLNNGLWVKTKCPWYLTRHRVVDLLMRPAWRVYEAALEGVMDDVIANAPDSRKKKLGEVAEEAQDDLLREARRICELADGVNAYAKTVASEPREVRKAFALTCQRDHEEDFALLMLAFAGKDLHDGVKKRLVGEYRRRYTEPLFGYGE